LVAHLPQDDSKAPDGASPCSDGFRAFVPSAKFITNISRGAFLGSALKSDHMFSAGA
jgi:hypothetical protein